MELEGRHMLVLGLGLSGLAMARWCARQGARVTVVDSRETPPQLQQLRQVLPQAGFVSGDWTADLLRQWQPDALCRSPGLSPLELAPLLQAAAEQELPVMGELDLFVQALAELRQSRGYAPQLLAVTGTNGKTTVTALTAFLLEHAGVPVAAAGNIAPSLLERLQQGLDADALPEVWVLELSSFQLDAVQAFEPQAAVLLNLGQDHLDWHGSMEAYVQAKARVFGSGGLMVLNRDDARVLELRPAVPSRPARGEAAEPRPVQSVGSGLPEAPGDYGIEDVAGMRWLVRAQPLDVTLRRRRDVEAEPLHLQRLMPVDALRIQGRHNALNAQVALALAASTGQPLGPMLYALREFRGLPHRLQSIGVLDGVEYFDDSKGTNVDATLAALHGLGSERSAGPSQAGESPLGGQRGHTVSSVGAAVERRLVLILGGDGKGQDFAPLRAPVQQYARAVVLLGRDGPAIARVLEGCGLPLLTAADLPEAVALAREQARAGDAVLLSPACSSLDMFTSYEERGRLFARAVQELARATGNEMEVPA